MARTSITADARRIARERLAKKIEARRQREQQEEQLVTGFEAARTRQEQAEQDMATAVAGLRDLGNSTGAVAELTALTEAEVRRLHKLALAAPTGEQVPQQASTEPVPARTTARSRHRTTTEDTAQDALPFADEQQQPVAGARLPVDE